MDVVPSSTPKNYTTIYIIVIGIMCIIIVGFLIYLAVSKATNSGLFAPYKIPLGTGLIYFNANDNPTTISELSSTEEAVLQASSAKATAELTAAEQSGLGIPGLLYLGPDGTESPGAFVPGSGLTPEIDNTGPYNTFLTTASNATPVPGTII